MCLTLPKKVLSVSQAGVKLKAAGRPPELAGALLKVKKGDWVLTQNSVIVKKITLKQAKEINSLLSS
ncbi:MAG: HypC/HybG/HupF family hydrogenase formation chaperone [Patescibacteria group bacterium]